MNLDYYATYRIRELQQEANRRRLVRQVQVRAVSSDLMATGRDLIGRQFIRLGTALTNVSQSNVAVMQPECVTCAC